jgi:O-antigen/teichoic acid export membrane protein
MSKAPENSVRRYGINAVSSVATRVLQLTVLVWVNQFLLRRIAPQEYSLYPLVLSLMLFAELFRTIFTAGLGRYIVEADSRDDEAGVTRVVSSMFPILVLVAAFFAVAGSLAAWQLHRILKIEAAYLWEARVMLLLLVGSLCVNVVAAPFAEGLYARQRFVALNLIGLGSEALRIVLLLGLLFGVSAKVMWLVVASTIAGILSTFLQVLITRRVLPAIRFRRECFSMATVRTLFDFGLWTTIGGIGGLVSGTVPALLLNRFGSPLDVTTFHLGRLADFQIRSILVAAGGPAQPALTRIYATKGEAAMTDLYYRGGRYHLWLALLLVAPLIVFGRQIFELYVGSQYSVSAAVMFAILGVYPLLMASAMFYQVAYAIGKVRAYYICDLAIQIVTLVALYYAVAVRGWGAVGAAAAMALTHGLLHLVLIWPMGLVLVAGRWGTFATRTLVPGVLPFAIASASAYGFRALFVMDSWLMVGVGSLAVLGIYVLVLLAFCLDPVDRGLVVRIVARARVTLGRVRGGVLLKAA